MSGKPTRAGRPSLAGLKWMLTTLAVALTLGLWQVFAGQPTPGDSVKPGNAVIQPTGDSALSGWEAFPTDVPVRIILDGAAAPAPLVVTRSS